MNGVPFVSRISMKGTLREGASLYTKFVEYSLLPQDIFPLFVTLEKVSANVPTMSIPPSMKPKLFAGDTIASTAGAPLNISPQDT